MDIKTIKTPRCNRVHKYFSLLRTFDLCSSDQSVKCFVLGDLGGVGLVWAPAGGGYRRLRAARSGLTPGAPLLQKGNMAQLPGPVHRRRDCCQRYRSRHREAVPTDSCIGRVSRSVEATVPRPGHFVELREAGCGDGAFLRQAQNRSRQVVVLGVCVRENVTLERGRCRSPCPASPAPFGLSRT